jgi:D-3-phosphoglycerate dehydrogenase
VSAPRWRVVRFDHWIHASFAEGLARDPSIELVVRPLPKTEDEAVEALSGAHAYHVHSAKDELTASAFVTARLLERCPGLVCVSTYGAGFDPVDVTACTAAGVAVVNQAGGNAVSVAEHTLCFIFSLVHRIAESDRRLRGERGLTREKLMGHEAAGLALGIVGIGHVGTRVAALARAVGLRVIAVDPFVPPEEIRRRGAEPASFEKVLERADIVTLHCPRDATTLGMMDASAFARMKKGAYFVSTARGGIHDEKALLEALETGHLAGAGLDVWDVEPPAPDHALLACANVIATFHTAGVTHEARRNVAVLGAEQLVAIFRGERPARLVNAQAWPAFHSRMHALMTDPRPLRL